MKFILMGGRRATLPKEVSLDKHRVMAKTVKPAAKSAKPKAAASKKEIGIKYTDKSAGQPELLPVFEAIKKRLLPYEKGTLRIRGGEGGQVLLVSEKKLVISGREKPELWFASALIQKGYVGFYFTPACEPQFLPLLHPDLRRCLKGKTCFHIKKADAQMLQHIEEALKAGYNSYKQRGWI